MKIPIFPGKYHQNGGFSMAMFVYRRVHINETSWKNRNLDPWIEFGAYVDDKAWQKCKPITVQTPPLWGPGPGLQTLHVDPLKPVATISPAPSQHITSPNQHISTLLISGQPTSLTYPPQK